MNELVSQAEFARSVGCSKANIAQIIKRGNKENRLVLVEQNGKILIDLEESKKTWETYASSAKKQNNDLPKNINKKKEKTKSIESDIVSQIASMPDLDNYTNDDLSISEVNKLKSISDVIRKTLDIEASRGTFVQRFRIEQILPSLLGGFKNRVVMIPQRTAEVIAAKLKDEKDIDIDTNELIIIIKTVLDKEHIEIINTLKKEVNY